MMKNNILHALSNRQGPFRTSLFGTNLDYKVHTPDPDEERVRQLLMLHDTSTDYYLRTYLAVMEAFPDIRAILGDDVCSYRLSDFKPAGLQMSGGNFAALQNLVGFYTDNAQQSFPLNFNYDIDYVNETLCKVTAKESGEVWFCTVIPSGNDPEKILRIQWAEDLPFEGPVLLNQSWVAGARVTIEVEPSQFPYKLVVERISGSNFIIKALTRYGWLDAFNHSFDAAEKLAMILVIVASAAQDDQTRTTTSNE